MKVYITKYALTQGIYCIEVRRSNTNPDVVRQVIEHPETANISNPFMFFGEGVQWHQTLAGAKKRVHVMIEHKKKALRKALRKLDKMHTAILSVLDEDQNELCKACLEDEDGGPDKIEIERSWSNSVELTVK